MAASKEIKQKHEQMFYPTVRVRAKGAGGSGTVIYSKNGKKIEVVLDVPLIEDLPKGFMSVRQGRRKLSWRNDKPASLVFVKALDDGDAAKKVSYRDELFINVPRRDFSASCA